MQSKTKVLFLIESLAGGGAEKVLTTLVQHINKQLFEVTVCAITHGGIYEEPISRVVKYKPIIKSNNQLLNKILYKLIYNYLPIRWVYNLFIPKDNDIEIAFCEGFATKLLSYSPLKQKIAWVHTDLISNPWTQGLVYNSLSQERESYARYAKIIGVSNNVSEAFYEKFSINIETIYNPINSSDILNKANTPANLPAKNRIRLVTAGRLVQQKGYDRLVKVVKDLRDAGFIFELWILGEGTDRDFLEDYIRKNNLTEFIHLCGFTNNPYPYIMTCDLFVCSSRSEGYSTAVTEALILGIPVITTKCSGMKELLGNENQWGIIVENNETSLYKPLHKILTNPQYLNELQNKAKERGAQFKIELLIASIENMLQCQIKR